MNTHATHPNPDAALSEIKVELRTIAANLLTSADILQLLAGFATLDRNTVPTEHFARVEHALSQLLQAQAVLEDATAALIANCRPTSKGITAEQALALFKQLAETRAARDIADTQGDDSDTGRMVQ